MNCQVFWKSVPESAIRATDGRAFLPGDAIAHLNQCPRCAAQFADQRSIASGLRLVALEFEGMRAPVRVETALLNEFRRNSGTGARPPRWWMPAGAWATAAAATAAVALLLLGVGAPRNTTAALQRAPHAQEWDAAHLSAADAQEYIPLPAVERIGPNEELDVVRVELSRSALLRLGMVVTPDWPAGPVKADVMLGQDGFARAIRILR